MCNRIDIVSSQFSIIALLTHKPCILITCHIILSELDDEFLEALDV